MSAHKEQNEKEASFTDFEQSYELASSKVGTRFLIKMAVIVAIVAAVIIGIAVSFGSLNEDVGGAFQMESKTLPKTFQAPENDSAQAKAVSEGMKEEDDGTPESEPPAEENEAPIDEAEPPAEETEPEEEAPPSAEGED